jgi:pimeloyl-ACP methyl ester carboxylesterase
VRVVYLHGFASGPSSRKAQHFATRLRERDIKVDVPQLDRGDFEKLTITGQLELLEELLNGAPADLIGSSMGGYVAALYAARHPEIRKLVLLAPAFGFTKRWPESLGAEAAEAWRTTGRMRVMHYASGEMRDIGWQLVEDGARYEDYPNFSQPALIFHGTRDTVVPIAWSEHFTATHPNVRLRVLDSDHELLNVIDTVGAESADFLAR